MEPLPVPQGAENLYQNQTGIVEIRYIFWTFAT
jgi:hypothetical protein